MDCPDEPGNDGGEGCDAATAVITGLVPVIHFPACAVDAIRREKAIKKYPRQWKINLIEAINPEWTDISSWLLDAR
jgi:predicted GIY-YIG superfamily endonuclease